ncbi:nitroreductase family protein [Thermodesulfobacteriota bacterium]
MKMSSLKEVILGRRSIRRYYPEKVPREKIMELFSIAAFAPSSCNLQAWHFVVVDDEDLKNKVIQEGKVNKQVLSAPTFIVATYNRNVTRENYANYQSLAAAIQNFLLLAHSEGLGTLWVCNFRDEGGIRQALDIPASHRVLAIIEVGYPKETPKTPDRSPAECFVSFNEFFEDDIIPETTIISHWRWKNILNWQKRFARRGYPLEKVTDAEKNEIPQLIIPYLEDKKSLELYALSAGITSVANKTSALIDHHFVAQDIYEAARDFEAVIDKRKILISDNLLNEDLSDYSNFLFINRLEHMPAETIAANIRRLSELKPRTKLVILFRNKYSWFGLYDFIVRSILNKKGIDDIYFGTLRNLGPWRLFSQGEIKRIIKEYDFKVIKKYGLFCFPTYRFRNSEWIRSKRGYAVAANVLTSFFSALELFLKLTGVSKIFGEQILFICNLEKMNG